MKSWDVSVFVTRRNAVLASIALLFVATAWLIGRTLGAFTPDPDYPYLLNGLDILALKAPIFVDHPGTPVQTIIAIVLGIAWLLTLPWHGLSNVQDEVLGHPQFYMECINCVFAAGNAAALVFFAWSVRKASGTVVPALIGLISIFQTFPVYVTFHRVMPEPVLLGATLVLAGVIAQQAFRRDGAREGPRFAIIVGILLAFCVTAKVTSGPLLLTIFFLRSWRAKLRAFAASAVSALAFLLPILPRWHGMMHNFLHILTHRGTYGTGAAGAPTPSEFLTNLAALWSTVPEMFVCLALFLVVLAGQYVVARRLPRNLARALLLCVVTIFAGLLLVAKQPLPYYLLPETAFVCLGNTIVAALLFNNVRIPIGARGVAAAMLIAVLAMQAFAYEKTHTQTQAIEARADSAVIQHAAQRGCLTIFIYAVNQTEFDLYFGNVLSGRRYGDRLAHLYPDFMTYTTGTGQFETFNETLSHEAAMKRFSQARCVDILGTQRKGTFGISAASLTLVEQEAGTYLYAFAPGLGMEGSGQR